MRAPECIWNAQAQLGEGPVWSGKEQALYWVDILNHRLHRYALTGEQRTWQFQHEVSAVAERANHPGLVVTVRHGFAFFDPVAEALTPVAILEDIPTNRFNDGKCDSRGRFWAGTMDFNASRDSGSLYRLTPALQWEKMDAGYTVTNGPTWSSDYRVMYHNDSARGLVYAFDYDIDTGDIRNKRVFLEFDKSEGAPDGMTTDAEGGVWIAHWGASKITRHEPDGTVSHTIRLPCSQITSCAFGGRDLTTLYITSAAVGLPPEQLKNEPLAGALFALELDIPGVPANTFGG